jgi:hypothetical protein
LYYISIRGEGERTKADFGKLKTKHMLDSGRICKVKRKLYAQLLAVREFSAVQRQEIHSGTSIYTCITVPSFV